MSSSEGPSPEPLPKKRGIPSHTGGESADCKRGRRKGATSKNVKNRQKVSKSFFDTFRQFSRRAKKSQKSSKSVKKRQKVFRHFSTIFARHLFSGPFCNPLGGSQFWKYSGGFKCLKKKGLGDRSCIVEGNSRKNSESVSRVFPEFFRNSFRKVPAVLGVWPISKNQQRGRQTGVRQSSPYRR